MLDYQKLIEEDVEELRRLERSLRDSAVSYRLRMLRLLKSGECRSVAQVTERLGYSLRQGQRWLQIYREGGVAALLQFERPRLTERMTPKAWERLKVALEKGDIATLEQARQLLAEQGVHYKGVAGVSALFKRHKVKLKTGRPLHRQSDEASRETFKKTSLSS